MAAALAWLVAWYLLHYVINLKLSIGWLDDAVSNIFQWMLSGAIAFAFVLGRLRTEIAILLTQHERTDPRVRLPLALFQQRRFKAMRDERVQMTSNAGAELSLMDLERLVAACFRARGAEPYVGTDSNVPSLFRKLYPTYLQEQFAKLPGGRVRMDVRILLVSEVELRSDYHADEQGFRDFYAEHYAKNNALLLQVDRDDAQRAAEECRLPSADLGIFGRSVVVFFMPIVRRGSASTYRIWVKPLGSELEKALQSYLRLLNQRAKEIVLDGGEVRCLSRNEEARDGTLDRLLWEL
jgi:hypothetical protein